MRSILEIPLARELPVFAGKREQLLYLFFNNVARNIAKLSSYVVMQIHMILILSDEGVNLAYPNTPPKSRKPWLRTSVWLWFSNAGLEAVCSHDRGVLVV